MLTAYKKLFFSVLLLVFVFVIQKSVCIAQTAETGECTSKETCESLLKKYENLLKEYDSDIQRTSSEKKSLQNQIALLKKKTESLAVQIKQSNAVIGDLKIQIGDTEKTIEDKEAKIRDSQRYLTTIIRQINENDQTSIVETLFSEPKLSSFFDNIVYLENLNEKSNQILQEIKGLKQSLEDQKMNLEDDKTDLEKQTQLKLLQKQEHEQAKAEYDKSLKVKESELAQTTEAKKLTSKVIAQIKARLFALAGTADSEAPNFEQAYKIAKSVGQISGVRPAFILAILTQESNVGKNVGQCYVTNDTTGAGIRITTGASVAKVMKPSRDIPAFITITTALSKDPHATRVSCPMSFGYGGAMGPAQFIPSTWNIYASRLETILKRPANPWNINDAFLATALYASDYGATSQTYDGEWRAAMIYFAGTVNKKYRFYGDNVMKIAAGYADDIAAIEGQ